MCHLASSLDAWMSDTVKFYSSHKMFCHPRIRGSFFKCATFPLSMQILKILKILGGIVSWLIVCLLCMFPTWICVQYSTVHCFEHRHEISCQRKQQKPEEGSYISDYVLYPQPWKGGPLTACWEGCPSPEGWPAVPWATTRVWRGPCPLSPPTSTSATCGRGLSFLTANSSGWLKSVQFILYIS